MLKRKPKYQIVGKWLDGGHFETVVYPTFSRAKIALHSFRNVALIDTLSLEIKVI